MRLHITYDYELFVNDITGGVDECLITPTNEILAMLKRQGAKATFFVDTAYLYRLKELGKSFPVLMQDFEKCSKQVKDMAAQGHEVALHIHSQWFYAQFDGTSWQMDFEHYKLSDMPSDEACKKFFMCSKLLKEISEYDVKSFRAGGFSIQDFNMFDYCMSGNNLINDSSALFKEKLISTLHKYDYTSLQSAAPYHFKHSVNDICDNGPFTEYPIITKKVSFIRYCLFRIKGKMQKDPKFRKWGNGGDLPERRKAEFKANVKNKLHPSVRIFATADGRLSSFLNELLRECKRQNLSDMTILGHPKLASPGSIANTETFIEKNKKHHSFTTFV